VTRIHARNIEARLFQSTPAPIGAGDKLTLMFGDCEYLFQSTPAPIGAGDKLNSRARFTAQSFNPHPLRSERVTALVD